MHLTLSVKQVFWIGYMSGGLVTLMFMAGLYHILNAFHAIQTELTQGIYTATVALLSTIGISWIVSKASHHEQKETL